MQKNLFDIMRESERRKFWPTLGWILFWMWIGGNICNYFTETPYIWSSIKEPNLEQLNKTMSKDKSKRLALMVKTENNLYILTSGDINPKDYELNMVMELKNS